MSVHEKGFRYKAKCEECCRKWSPVPVPNKLSIIAFTQVCLPYSGTSVQVCLLWPFTDSWAKPAKERAWTKTPNMEKAFLQLRYSPAVPDLGSRIWLFLSKKLCWGPNLQLIQTGPVLPLCTEDALLYTTLGSGPMSLVMNHDSDWEGDLMPRCLNPRSLSPAVLFNSLLAAVSSRACSGPFHSYISLLCSFKVKSLCSHQLPSIILILT